MGRRWALPVLVLLFLVQLLPLQAQTGSVFTPIAADTAGQLRLMDTIPDYIEQDNYCRCNVQFFSANGRTVATDTKIRDLVGGQTIDLTGHGYALALSPDGARALVAGNEAGTRIVDVATGTELRLMDDDAEAATFSPDGTLVAVSSRDSDAVQVWDSAGALVKALEKPGGYGGWVSFTGDGEWLVYQANQYEVYRWKTGTQEDGQHLTTAFDFRLADDGETLLARTNSISDVEVWDVPSAQRLAYITDERALSSVNNIALSSDRQRLGITYSGSDGRVELWNMTTSPATLIKEVASDEYRYALFTPDSKLLIVTAGRVPAPCEHEAQSCSGGSGSWSDKVQFFDAATGEAAGSFSPYDGDRFDYTALTPDGHALITGQYFGGTRLWGLNGTNAELIAEVPGSSFILSPDGSSLLTEFYPSLLAVYGIPSAERAVRPYVLSGSIVPSTVNVRAQPNADAEVVGTASGDVRVLGRSNGFAYLPEQGGWVRADPQYLRLNEELPLEALPEIAPAGAGSALAPIIPLTAAPIEADTSVTFALEDSVPLPSLMLSVGDPVIAPTDVPNGFTRITPENAAQVALLGTLPRSTIGETTYPSRIPAISLDGTLLFVPPDESDSRGRAWDLSTMQEVGALEVRERELYSNFRMAFAASSHGLVAYRHDYEDERFELRSLNAFEERYRIALEDFYILERSLVFSPDGQTLYTPRGLFDVTNSSYRVELDNVGKAWFSPDSRLLALLSNQRAYIIDVESGEQVALTPRETDNRFYPQSAIFSPDNRWLATNNDRLFRVYDAATGTALFTAPSRSLPGTHHSQSAFSADGRYLLVFSPDDGIFDVYNVEARQAIGSYTLAEEQAYRSYLMRTTQPFAFSPDGRLLAVGNPLGLIELATGEEAVIDGNYQGVNIAFTPDGATLLVDSGADEYTQFHTVMVFGIPSEGRPEFQPLTARVVPSGINARTQPDADAPTVAGVSGEIGVSARNAQGTALYVPAAGGWVWAAPAYVDLGDTLLESLPVRIEGGE